MNITGYYLKKVRIGRLKYETFHIVVSTLDEAIDIAVYLMQQDKPGYGYTREDVVEAVCSEVFVNVKESAMPST